MNAGPGIIIASPSPGDINGQSAAPANVGNIMQNMFTEMISPEAMPGNGKPNIPSGQPQVQPQAQPVVLQQPAKTPVKIEPELNLFADEPVEAAVETPVDDEPDMSDIPDEPAKENWKKAREALRETRKSVKTLTQEFESTKSKLERYEKGEIVPEIISAKDAKIAQLEKYETIVNGKLSDEYQSLVVAPTKEKSGALNKLAEDYNVPEHIRAGLIQKIVETENERERNSLITKYFPDAIGATKVENIVKDLHQLGTLALDMDNKPKETLQALQTQYQEKKQQEATIIANQFESVSKVSWTKALEKTANEGLFTNLILDPNNTEHNAIAEKNQHRAAIQFGALMKKLHENGLRTAPEDLTTGLARSLQLAVGGVGLAKELQAAHQRIAELEGTSGVLKTYLRPGMNNNGGGNRPVTNPAQEKGPANPREAGMAAAQVFSKR